MSDPISPEFREVMGLLAGALDRVLNGEARAEDRKNGFVLLTFPFGDAGRVNYISNADRADMRVALKELLARWEGQPEMKGRA